MEENCRYPFEHRRSIFDEYDRDAACTKCGSTSWHRESAEDGYRKRARYFLSENPSLTVDEVVVQIIEEVRSIRNSPTIDGAYLRRILDSLFTGSQTEIVNLRPQLSEASRHSRAKEKQPTNRIATESAPKVVNLRPRHFEATGNSQARRKQPTNRSSAEVRHSELIPIFTALRSLKKSFRTVKGLEYELNHKDNCVRVAVRSELSHDILVTKYDSAQGFEVIHNCSYSFSHGPGQFEEVKLFSSAESTKEFLITTCNGAAELQKGINKGR